MAKSPDLVTTLDAAATLLLEKAGLSVNGGATDPVVAQEDSTLAEQVKAFQAVVDYAQARGTLAPPSKDSKFDRIKQQFDGQPAKRRGAAGPASSSTGAESADEPG